MNRPVITGVTFAADITTPVEVVGPARWGWFANGLNVTPSANREAAYATARRIANRRNTSVQIYAQTYADMSKGWQQVDVVAKPERELCEWWPERNEPATGIPGQGCTNTATTSVGKTVNWHLCDSCAGLPPFRKLSRRGRLPGYYAQNQEA